jgi:hypothetical protein
MYNSLENKELPLLTVRFYTATTAQIIPRVRLKAKFALSAVIGPCITHSRSSEPRAVPYTASSDGVVTYT